MIPLHVTSDREEGISSVWPRLDYLIQFITTLRNAIKLQSRRTSSRAATASYLVQNLLRSLETSTALVGAQHEAIGELHRAVKIALADLVISLRNFDQTGESSPSSDAEARINHDAAELDRTIVKLLRDGRKAVDSARMDDLTALRNGTGETPRGLGRTVVKRHTTDRFKALCSDMEDGLARLRSITKRRIG